MGFIELLPKMKQHGFSFVEVLIGIGIILFILAGMNGIFGVGIVSNRKAENVYIALGLAQESLEGTLAKSFDKIVSVSETQINEFKRRIDVKQNYDGNESKKLVIVTVTGLDIKDVRLSCIISNTSLEPVK